MSRNGVSHPLASRQVTPAETQPGLLELLRQAVQHHQHGHLQQAEELYRQVLHDDPTHAEALHGLGVLASQQGHDTLAVALVRQAIARKAHIPSFHNTLGNVLRQQGAVEAAVAAYRMALCLQPTYALAHRNLGMILREQGQLDTAIHHLQAALQCEPDVAAVHYQLGLAHLGQGEQQLAVAHFEAALRLQPDCAAAAYSLGNILQTQGDLEAAQAYLERAVALVPDWAEAHNNLGNVLRQQGQLATALDHLERAMALAPDYALARWNRALVWLAQGNLTQGWPAYEWRWQVYAPLPALPQPLWDGSHLAGRTVLVWAEQGLGDELLFASCLPELIEQAGHCVMACDPRLVALLTRTFPTATVHGSARDDFSWLSAAPPVDVHIPLGSLPRYLRPTLASFPPPAGFLIPDAARRAQYQQRLATLGPGLKVGLAWRSLRARQARPSYPPLAQWSPVLTLPGVHFINLQYDDSAAELEAARQQWGVTIHSWDDLDLFHDLDGVAALSAALDLVLAPDTTVAALAGSVGQTVWRLTGAGRPWDMLGTAGYPWFPSVRIIQQQQRWQWDEVMARVAQELAHLVHGTRRKVSHER